ncbi:MAG: glycosyltransferase family 2 protein [Myxococcota bacterium]|jgi:glycosyltransferase involved in cell wall biosynthesis|nr:glycosyltransferase family 2 protein [Myxococcota bacterium]
MKLVVVIPAFNAGATLEAVLLRMPAGLDVHRVVVVNDGSRDRTASLLAELKRRDPRIEPVELPTNGGYGAAMKRGLARALSLQADIVACVHADGQYAPEELPRLIGSLMRRELDLLQGSRHASGTALAGGMPLYKYAAGKILCALERRVFDLDLSDFHSGYLLYGRRALFEIPFERLSVSFDFDLEVIASARNLGLAVGEEPIPTHYGAEVSHLRPLAYGTRVLWVMARHLTGRYREGVLRASHRSRGRV